MKANISIQVKNEHLLKVGIRIESYRSSTQTIARLVSSCDQTSRWIEVKLVLGIFEM